MKNASNPLNDLRTLLSDRRGFAADMAAIARLERRYGAYDAMRDVMSLVAESSSTNSEEILGICTEISRLSKVDIARLK